MARAHRPDRRDNVSYAERSGSGDDQRREHLTASPWKGR